MHLSIESVKALTRPRWSVLATALGPVTHHAQYLDKPIPCWTRKRAESEMARLQALFTPGTVTVTVEQVGPVTANPVRQWIALQAVTLVCGWIAYWYSTTYPIHHMPQGPVLAVYGVMLMASVLVEAMMVAFGETNLDDAAGIRLRSALWWFALTDVAAILAARTAIWGNVAVTIQVFAILAPAILVALRLMKAGTLACTVMAISWVITWWGVGLSHMSVSVTEVLGYVLAVAGIAGCVLTAAAVLAPRWVSVTRSGTP